MQTVNLNKKVYSKNQYEKVIDTKFSQLATTLSPSEQITQTTPISVEEFFQYYEQLFLVIPKEGEINSHEYLIKTSSEYVDSTATDETIQALIDEINILQQQNLELNQQIVDLTVTTVNTSNSPIRSSPLTSTFVGDQSIQNITQQSTVALATRGRG
jgi:predicted  nucleic acid-binding Zn-ribbon protein